MSADENVAAVRDFIERTWNAGHEAVFEEHLAVNIAHPGGRDGFKAMVLDFRWAFPDLAMEVRDIFGVNDKVVTRWTMRGTHEASFLGNAPGQFRLTDELLLSRVHAQARVTRLAWTEGRSSADEFPGLTRSRV